MTPEFRSRVFTPVILPLTVIGAIFAFAMALSRVLLAVPEAVSTLTAIVIAGYILLVSALVAARPRITSRALGVGLVLGFAGVLAAGTVAGAAGMRELHGEDAAAAADQGEGGGSGGAGGAGGAAGTPGGTAGGDTEIPPGALLFVADASLEFVEAPTTATAGRVTIALDNPSGLPHNVTFEGVEGDEPIVEATDGVDVADLELEPRTYTYYCSVPGHRQAGMEGQLTVQ